MAMSSDCHHTIVVPVVMLTAVTVKMVLPALEPFM